MPALRAVTIDAAWQVFMDDQVGSIVPGKRADPWCFLITHSLRITFRAIRVDRTIIDGTTVYKRL